MEIYCGLRDEQAVIWSFMYDYFNRRQGSSIGFAQARSLGEIHYFLHRGALIINWVHKSKRGRFADGLFPLFKSTIKVWVISKLMNCKKDTCQIPWVIT